MNGADIGSSGERLGLLLGPEPQGDDLLVEDSIPLASEYRFPCSPKMLLADLDAVQPMLEKARQERSHTIVGTYRFLGAAEDGVFDNSLSESGYECLSASGQEHSSLPDVRCCFVFVWLSASETLVRVYMRNGEHWDQIHELTLQWEPRSSHLTSKDPAAPLNVSEPPNAAGNAWPILEDIHGRGRLWFDVITIALLLLSLAANTFMVRFIRRMQHEEANLHPVVNQIRASTASVSQLPPPTAVPAPPESPPSKPQAAKKDLPARQVSNPPSTRKLAITTKPATLKVSEAFREEDLPPKQVSNPPTTGKLTIAKKPATLKPSEAFQFEVNGNPAPEVIWSEEGPGSIDPVYGLYRAPSQFAGETRVRIIAKSWRGSQSVTFTLKGGPK